MPLSAIGFYNNENKGVSMYQGLKIKMAFIYGVWSDSITQFGISAVYLSKYINHAKWTDAVFYYGGYDFYYGGNFYEPFFKKTHKSHNNNLYNS